MVRRGVHAIGVVVALAAGGAPAAASTVSFTPPPLCGPKFPCDPPVVRLVDPEGQVDQLTLAREAESYVFSDAAAQLTAGAGCQQRSERVVACPDAGAQVFVSLGGGDDLLSAGGVRAFVDGGDGNDRLLDVANAAGGSGTDELVGTESGDLGTSLAGGEGDDVVTGGGDDDRLEGGAGQDRVSGGGGDDRLIGDGAEGLAPVADVIDGGEGADSVSYSGRREGVVVDLADPGVDGAPGEGDALTGVENVNGGSGEDVLTGDDGPNRLVGGRGDDLLTGAGGNDELYGASGRDALAGGDGDDLLDGDAAYGLDDLGIDDRPDRRRTVNRVDCGDGADMVLDGSGLNLVAAGCEALVREIDVSRKGTVIEPLPVRLGRRRATFHVGCAIADRRQRRCRGELTLRPGFGGRPLGRRSFNVGRTGGDVTVRVRRGDLRDGRLRVELSFRAGGSRLKYLISPARVA